MVSNLSRVSKRKRKRQMEECEEKICMINTKENRASCGECRYKKCVQVGMSLSRIRYGRRVNSCKPLNQCLFDVFDNFKQKVDPFLSSSGNFFSLYSLLEEFYVKSINLINKHLSSSFKIKSSVIKSNILLAFYCALFEVDSLNEKYDEKFRRLKSNLKSLISLSSFNQTNFTDTLKCLCFMLVMFNFIQDEAMITTSAQDVHATSIEKCLMNLIKCELVSFFSFQPRYVDDGVNKIKSFVELIQWLTQIQNCLNSYANL
jgi:hypothetical protein